MTAAIVAKSARRNMAVNGEEKYSGASGEEEWRNISRNRWRWREYMWERRREGEERQ